MIKRVLVVEDSEVEGIYIKGLLDRIDKVDVTIVRTHAEAIECCNKSAFNLVLIDSIMPDAEPYELLDAIHKTSDNQKVKALVMGNASDFAEENYLEKTGFTNYLEKPLEYHMLRAAISMYA